MLAEYQKAPQVTRERMYLDTMQEIYTNVTKVMVDSKAGSNLLYLPLDKIIQSAGAVAPATSPVTVSPPSSTSPSTPATGSAAGSARSRERESR